MDGWKEPAAPTEREVEQALDSAIDALIVLDSGALSQLAEVWGTWEITPLCIAVSEEERARLRAKLALLGRLLRQTAIGLSLLGLPVGGYALHESARIARYPLELTLQRG
jgi:hypothetical protein